MSFEQISYLGQIVASVGVIVSLIFVGLQIRQNTGSCNEHNSTMAQWTVIRMAIARNRDIAELMTAGLHGERTMDAADQLRAGADASRTGLGGFSHLGQNAARYLSERGLSKRRVGHSCAACSKRRSARLGGAAPNMSVPSRVRLGRRRPARQELTRRWS
jgi:hypothetical protein